jgi:hypothetical protein
VNLNQDAQLTFDAFQKWLRLDDATSGRHSVTLLADLYMGTVVQECLNPYKVLHEIRALEGRGEKSLTKPPTQFLRAPLKGLWHKHHAGEGVQALAHNVSAELKKSGSPAFEAKIAEAAAAKEERFFTAADIKWFVDDVVTNNLKRRAADSRLTGDWLIYAQHAGRNYYLCLGSHTTGDQLIRDKLDMACLKEFPFLQAVLA